MTLRATTSTPEGLFRSRVLEERYFATDEEAERTIAELWRVSNTKELKPFKPARQICIDSNPPIIAVESDDEPIRHFAKSSELYDV
jgi:hypothetical protein